VCDSIDELSGVIDLKNKTDTQDTEFVTSINRLRKEQLVVLMETN
jgi:hypothetical protein